MPPRDTKSPVKAPTTKAPTHNPSGAPSNSKPTTGPSRAPSKSEPTNAPSKTPSKSEPTNAPSRAPSKSEPTNAPSRAPSKSEPTNAPSKTPSNSKPTTETNTPDTSQTPTVTLDNTLDSSSTDSTPSTALSTSNEQTSDTDCQSPEEIAKKYPKIEVQSDIVRKGIEGECWNQAAIDAFDKIASMINTTLPSIAQLGGGVALQKCATNVINSFINSTTDQITPENINKICSDSISTIGNLITTEVAATINNPIPTEGNNTAAFAGGIVGICTLIGLGGVGICYATGVFKKSDELQYVTADEQTVFVHNPMHDNEAHYEVASSPQNVGVFTGSLDVSHYDNRPDNRTLPNQIEGDYDNNTTQSAKDDNDEGFYAEGPPTLPRTNAMMDETNFGFSDDFEFTKTNEEQNRKETIKGLNKELYATANEQSDSESETFDDDFSDSNDLNHNPDYEEDPLYQASQEAINRATERLNTDGGYVDMNTKPDQGTTLISSKKLSGATQSTVKR